MSPALLLGIFRRVAARGRRLRSFASGYRRRASARRHRTPVLEGLEGIRLLSTTSAVISGFVYNDVNNNGLFDAGEPPIAGSTIALRNAAGVTIGTAVTGANGFYQFDTNATIDTAPASQTQTASVPSTLTNFTASPTPAIQQFNPALGQLTSVEVTNAANITAQFNIHNIGAGGPITASINGDAVLTGGGVDLPTPISGQNLTPNPVNGNSLEQSASASGTNSVTVTDAATLANFTGTGTVAFSEAINAKATGTGSGNFQASVTTAAATTVQVIYHYIPSNALTPGTYTVVQVGEPAGYSNGKVSSNGVIIPQTPGVPDTIPITVTAANLVAPNNDFGEILLPPGGQTGGGGTGGGGGGTGGGGGQIVGPPGITSLIRYGVHQQPVTVVLTFDQAMNAAAAQDLNNYRLAEIARPEPFGLFYHKPINIPLKSATYDAAHQTVTLVAKQHLDVHRIYQLTVNGTTATGLTSTQGVLLDGADTGQPGSNFVGQFGRTQNVRFFDHQGNFDTLTQVGNRLKITPVVSAARVHAAARVHVVVSHPHPTGRHRS
ncbi:MAG TPA: choice-of-anchor E domain-containing protein [Isosphaeraceae bacterium]|jgi:hypothetical protein|nr:choice-of-anchor E domain-containing protein [Isosphaeraceae bacterium]